MRLCFCILLLATIFFPFLSHDVFSSTQTPKKLEKVNKLIKHGGYIVQKGSATIISKKADSLFIPASILKIATALTSMNVLGPDFRFETVFYQNKQGDLYIQGKGDPFLISEEVSLILEHLKQKGIVRINNIFLDDTLYQVDDHVDGVGKSLNPYDVINGGLCVNFNTVYVTVSPQGKISSAEPQTPTLPIMKELARSMPPGNHRFNISKNKDNVMRYVGELFRALQKENGISGNGRISKVKVPGNLPPLYTHRSSKTIQSSIQDLMLYSNNFIANQFFLACGAKRFGYPATWDKAQKTMQMFLQAELGLDDQKITIMEGSGISRKNRITPFAMNKILTAFKPYAHTLPLEKGRLIKSGTLTGIYSYAGYFKNNSKLDTFVVILNQKKNTRDSVLNLLEKIYLDSF